VLGEAQIACVWKERLAGLFKVAWEMVVMGSSYLLFFKGGEVEGKVGVCMELVS
jgi:hypothetical protein